MPAGGSTLPTVPAGGCAPCWPAANAWGHCCRRTAYSDTDCSDTEEHTAALMLLVILPGLQQPHQPRCSRAAGDRPTGLAGLHVSIQEPLCSALWSPGVGGKREPAHERQPPTSSWRTASLLWANQFSRPLRASAWALATKNSSFQHSTTGSAPVRPPSVLQQEHQRVLKPCDGLPVDMQGLWPASEVNTKSCTTQCRG